MSVLSGIGTCLAPLICLSLTEAGGKHVPWLKDRCQSKETDSSDLRIIVLSPSLPCTGCTQWLAARQGRTRAAGSALPSRSSSTTPPPPAGSQGWASPLGTEGIKPTPQSFTRGIVGITPMLCLAQIPVAQAARRRAQKYPGTRTTHCLNTGAANLFFLYVFLHFSIAFTQRETCLTRGWAHTGRGKGKHQEREKPSAFGEWDTPALFVAKRN